MSYLVFTFILNFKFKDMKNYIFILTLLFSFSVSAQDLYWYDVLLDVKNETAKDFEKAVDDFYSSVDFPEGVSMTFSNIQIKGQGFKETHILSFVSPSSQSLADLRASLSGKNWDDYIDIVRPLINYKLSKYLRVSLGTRKEMNAFKKELKYYYNAKV